MEMKMIVKFIDVKTFRLRASSFELRAKDTFYYICEILRFQSLKFKKCYQKRDFITTLKPEQPKTNIY